MKRLFISTLLSVTSMVFVQDASFAKKKPEKRVQEQFEATISAPTSGVKTLTIVIEEFSTDDEVRELAQTFSNKGEAALVHALGKAKKGRYYVYESMPIRAIISTSEGGGRKLDIVGDAPPEQASWFMGYDVAPYLEGYPWTFIQLSVDEQGNGKGLIIPYAKVVFNDKGRIVVKPRGLGKIPQLVNVHLVK
jgi:hypothetical protein